MGTEEERTIIDLGESCDESSLYENSKTKIKVGSEFSEEFYVAVGITSGICFVSLLFAIVVDVVTENARKGLMKGFLCRLFAIDE